MLGYWRNGPRGPPNCASAVAGHQQDDAGGGQHARAHGDPTAAAGSSWRASGSTPRSPGGTRRALRRSPTAQRFVAARRVFRRSVNSNFFSFSSAAACELLERLRIGVDAIVVERCAGRAAPRRDPRVDAGLLAAAAAAPARRRPTRGTGARNCRTSSGFSGPLPPSTPRVAAHRRRPSPPLRLARRCGRPADPALLALSLSLPWP